MKKNSLKSQTCKEVTQIWVSEHVKELAQVKLIRFEYRRLKVRHVHIKRNTTTSSVIFYTFEKEISQFIIF